MWTQLKDYLIDQDDNYIFDHQSKSATTLTRYLKNPYNKGQYRLDQLLHKNYLVLDTRQSDLRLYEKVIPTLRTGRHGILYTRNGVLRKLSGLESLLLQGVPIQIAKKAHSVSQTKLLSQAGNAMTVDVVEALGKMLLQQVNPTTS